MYIYDSLKIYLKMIFTVDHKVRIKVFIRFKHYKNI